MSGLVTRLPAAALLLAALGGCDDLLVEPARRPAGLAVALAPDALQALSAAGAREAFDAVDSVRVVLLDADPFTGGDPFRSEAPRLLDRTMPFAPADTVRVSVELADSAVSSERDLVMAVMLKSGGAALFVFADSVVLRPNETTRALVPLLLPVPAGVVLRAERDTVLAGGDSLRVDAVGLFATGDTIPDGQFFPELTSLDPALLSVEDEGTRGWVRGSAPGVGRVEARASGEHGDRADTVAITVRMPVATSDTAVFQQLAVGGDFACGLQLEGPLFCWGSNAYGTFGDGTTTSSTTPAAGMNGRRFTSVAAGTDHACGIDVEGTLFCWGRNDSGQLGNGTTGGGSEPTGVQVAGGPWSNVSAGETHTCAIAIGGALYCWGDGSFGQLGLGGYHTTGTPTRVGTELWTSVSAGVRVTCGMTSDADAKCWGSGANGVIGNGSIHDALTPVTVGGLWQQVRLGRVHACGVDHTGSLHCWGRNIYGQLGIAAGPSSIIYSVPQRTQLQTSLSSLDPGSFHTCVVRSSDGTYKCWGDDGEGQLGEGTPPGPGWRHVDASLATNFTCALRADDRALCWGDGSSGQLGNGDLLDSAVPVPVRAPAIQVTTAQRSNGGVR